MNNRYFLVLASLFLFAGQASFGQAILLDDNHNLDGLPFNGKIILSSDLDSTLWSSNGTAAGTQPLSTVRIDDNGSAFLNNKLYFGGINAANGSELWVTDNSSAGTVLVSDIVPGMASSSPSDFVTYLNKIYFTAATPGIGRELYVYNGSGSPAAISDINPGAADGFIDPTYYILNNTLFFDAVNGTGKALYSYNGVSITKQLDFPAGYNLSGYSAIGNTLFFFIRNGSDGFRIYKSTGGSTTLVKAFSGPYSGAIFPQVVSWNNKIFFTAAELDFDFELWTTDGINTQMVKDINPGTGGSSPLLFNSVILNNKLVFAATTDDSGTELWTTDGTAAGTNMLIDLNSQDAEGSDPFVLPVIKPFDGSSAQIYNEEIYDRAANYNGFIFFSATNGTNGTELYKTDGTAAGTSLVKELIPGIEGGMGDAYMYTNSGLVFAGNNGTSGVEPWKSDGTAAGTFQIADINSTGDSNPYFSFIWNGDIYLSADNGNGGTAFTDFYKLQGPFSPLPVSLGDLKLTVQPASVLLNWNTLSESNSDQFEIMRSTDGVYFTKIGSVGAAGESSTEKRYAYADLQAYQQGVQVLYYRLNMKDKDGRSALSKIVKATLESPVMQVSVYPNPAQDILKLRYTTASPAQIKITDLNGQTLMTRSVSIAENAVEQINISHLPKGSYLLQFENKQGTSTTKFMRK